MGWLRVSLWVYGSMSGVARSVAVVAVDLERRKVLYRVISKSTSTASTEREPSLEPEQEGDLDAFTAVPGQEWDF